MWTPVAEAVGRAGSFEALLPFLIDGRIQARAAAFCTAAGGTINLPRRDIPPVVWKWARFDPATQRVYFATNPFVLNPTPAGREILFAVGVELEAAPVEAFFPARAKPSGRKRGKKPSKVWQEIFGHFDPVVATTGPFLSVYSAANSVEAWLEGKNKKLSRSAIERGISTYRPRWIAA